MHTANGQVLLRGCEFTGWESETSLQCAVAVTGEKSALEAQACRFFDSDFGIDVSDKATAIVDGCNFVRVCNPFGVTNGSIVSRNNSMMEGGCFVSLGENSTIDSHFDSVIHPECLLDGSEATDSTANFNHLTVSSRSLLGISIWESPIHSDPDQKWVWAAPKVYVADSIIFLESTDPFAVRFTLSALQPCTPRLFRLRPVVFSTRSSNSALPRWDVSQLHVWDYVWFGGYNMIHARPDFPGDDPGFGEIDHGKLSLNSDSPAIGAAFDGTNLGAWQGNVE